MLFINLYGNQNTYKHTCNFANGVFKVFACFVILHKVFSYMPKEFNHSKQRLNVDFVLSFAIDPMK